MQHADLLVTQQWLRNRMWQLSVTHGLASDSSPHAALTPACAVEITQTTLRICQAFSRSALDGNGVGFVRPPFFFLTLQFSPAC